MLINNIDLQKFRSGKRKRERERVRLKHFFLIQGRILIENKNITFNLKKNYKQI